VELTGVEGYVGLAGLRGLEVHHPGGPVVAGHQGVETPAED
jgi:hypothetical protein